MNTEAPLSRRQVVRSFKMRGMALQASACDAVMNVLDREQQAKHDVLNALLDELCERRQPVITQELLASVVADLSRDGRDVHEEALQLLNAYDTPRLDYDTMRKQFTLVNEQERSFFGEANDKADMFAHRFALVQQRILRQDLFRPKLVTADGRSSDGRNVTHAITPVESLLGRAGVKFLLGMITQVEEGRYYLEDSTAQVPLDLSETQVLTDGFITENCIVLVEGEMVDGTLHVLRMGNPIVETRLDSRETIGLANSDLFHSMSTMAELDKLGEQEKEHGPDGMFVIMSDVHLDKPSVLEKLETLFEGFQEMDPLPIFVLMGNFCSVPIARDGPKAVMANFDDLANVIAKFPRIASQGKFIFVPGPNDPGMADILPRPALPKHFTSGLRSKLSHVHFATNPCRLRYFSKEIVLTRQDVVHKLRRHCILKPRSSEWVQHTVKTILDQGHLSPLPLHASPIYWQFDNALRLYPLPDAVILGDVVDQYYENYADCDAINPGPFANDFDFVVYRPVASVDDDGHTKSDVEFSQIMKE